MLQRWRQNPPIFETDFQDLPGVLVRPKQASTGGEAVLCLLWLLNSSCATPLSIPRTCAREWSLAPWSFKRGVQVNVPILRLYSPMRGVYQFLELEWDMVWQSTPI